MKWPALKLTPRTINLTASFICWGLLIFAVFLQHQLKLHPCPLCVLQRVVVVLLGLLFLMAALLHLKLVGYRIFQFIILLTAGLGIALAGRHVWLEGLPVSQVAGCGASLKHIFNILSVPEAVKSIFLGIGQCGVVEWRFLTLSIPRWTLIFFIFFALIALSQIFYRPPRLWKWK